MMRYDERETERGLCSHVVRGECVDTGFGRRDANHGMQSMPYVGPGVRPGYLFLARLDSDEDTTSPPGHHAQDRQPNRKAGPLAPQ